MGFFPSTLPREKCTPTGSSAAAGGVAAVSCSNAHMQTVLCVAEKPSIAKSIAVALSDGDLCTHCVSGGSATPVHELSCVWPPHSGSRAKFLVTSVSANTAGGFMLPQQLQPQQQQ